MANSKQLFVHFPVRAWYILIPLVTVIAYFPALSGSFTNWDDSVYINENPFITSLSIATIGKLFTSFFMGNYHPLSMMSLSVDYAIYGFNPFGFHLTNLILHILNSILVLIFVRKLTDNFNVAAFAGLLFGVHTLHVESVAWISERKDVLYTLFFMLSLTCYLEFLRAKSAKWYITSLLLFILSCLSKGQGVTLAATLVLIDLFYQRQWKSRTVIFEKVPFFIIAIFFGVLAFIAQATSDALTMAPYPFNQRFAFASYGLVNYVMKLFFPFSLSAFYPYPIAPGESLPLLYYAYLIPAVTLIACWLICFRKSKQLFFGIGFFLLNIVMLLQMFPVGRAIMADRYAYLPSVGYCFLIAWYLRPQGVIKSDVLVLGIISCFVLFFSVLTFQRSKVWQNSLILWSDVVEKDPSAGLAYFNRGNVYMNKGDSMLAYRDYSECIKVDPDHWEAYVNRGTILSGQAAYFRAIADFDSAIMIDSTKVQAYINRANAFKQLEMIQEAVNDYSKIINLDPGNMNAVLQRGNLLLIAGDSLGARRDIEAGTRLNPDSEAGINLKSELAFNRAKKAESDGNLQVAVKLYKEALKIRPTYPEPWFFLGVCYGKLGQTTEAIECLSRAIDLRKDYSVALASRGIAFASSGKFKEALSDLGVAIELEKQNGLFRFNRALVYLNMGNKDAACTDLKSALEYGYGDARVVYSRECMNR